MRKANTILVVDSEMKRLFGISRPGWEEIFTHTHTQRKREKVSWGSDRTNWVRSPTEAKDFFSSLCVQTSSEAHPASSPMGTGGPFLGVKRGRGVMLTTHPNLVMRSRMSRSYTSSPSAYMAVAGQLYFYILKT
jgi:hypothetical protein